MTETPELLPCPFCGSTEVDPKGWMSVNNDGTQKKTGPACDECGGSTESVERWNTCTPSTVGVEARPICEYCNERHDTRVACPAYIDYVATRKKSPTLASEKEGGKTEGEIWQWLLIEHRPLQTGHYIVAHRGHEEILHFFGPDKHWLPGTIMGWRRLGKSGWERDDPVARFRATHCALIPSPPPARAGVREALYGDDPEMPDCITPVGWLKTMIDECKRIAPTLPEDADPSSWYEMINEVQSLYDAIRALAPSGEKK